MFTLRDMACKKVSGGRLGLHAILFAKFDHDELNIYCSHRSVGRERFFKKKKRKLLFVGFGELYLSIELGSSSLSYTSYSSV